jgi:hypothetical protein
MNRDDHAGAGEFSDWEDEDAWEDQWEEERERLVHACAQKIIACWKDVSRHLGTPEAWDLFAAFLKIKKPRKKKGCHNSSFDSALLAAYDKAPRGKKLAAARAIGKKHRKSAETTEKHLYRLRRSRRQNAAEFKAWVDRCSSRPA